MSLYVPLRQGTHPQQNLQPANFPKAGAKRLRPVAKTHSFAVTGPTSASIALLHLGVRRRRPKIFDEGLRVLEIDAGAISVDAVSLWRYIRSFPTSMASRINHATTMARFASACS